MFVCFGLLIILYSTLDKQRYINGGKNDVLARLPFDGKRAYFGSILVSSLGENHRKKTETEEKAKVVAAVWGRN